jgi:tryptophanyl-tRNA synthetase
MSKSYNNAFALTQSPEDVAKTLRAMPTDPARVRRTDPGDPAKCPVFSFHKLYSQPDDLKWVEEGCKSASIGCGDCKKRLAERINEKMAKPFAIKQELLSNPEKLDSLIADGCARARSVAKRQLEQVKDWTGFKPSGDWV